MVHIKPFPDDFRNCPVDWNLRQTLVIPDAAKEPSRLGRVMALGNGLTRDGERYQFSVKPGDIVLCTRYPKSAANLRWNGEDVLIVDEHEILAKVNA